MAHIQRDFSDAAVIAALASVKGLNFGTMATRTVSADFAVDGSATVSAQVSWTLSPADAQTVFDAAAASSTPTA